MKTNDAVGLLEALHNGTALTPEQLSYAIRWYEVVPATVRIAVGDRLDALVPVKPRFVHMYNFGDGDIPHPHLECGNCKTVIVTDDNFCRICGRPIDKSFY